MKRFFSMVAIFIALLLPAAGVAHAANYTVVYAIEVGGKTETGKIESCAGDGGCEIVSDALQLTVRTGFYASRNGKATVSLDGRWRGCCFFSDAVNSIDLDPEMPLHRLSIFEGHARRRNEVVSNHQVGVLYLKFLDAR